MKHFVRLGVILFLLALTGKQVTGAEPNNWPKKIEKDGGTVIIYQPQVESLTENRLQSRAAVSVSNEETPSPIFGAMWFDCKVSTDRDQRTVLLLDMEVTAARFPDVDEEKIRELNAFLEQLVPEWEMELSLDQLLADLDETEVAASLSEGLNNAPPEIIFSTTPAMLILLDGDPIFEEIENTGYERVVNTPFFVVKDGKKGNYYIHGSDQWYTSDNFDAWEVTEKVPKKLKQIAEEALTDTEVSEDAAADQERDENIVPDIILRTSPAELLQSDGEPEFKPIEGTSLLYMSNTADDILMNIDTQEYFILVSGRWYRSKSVSEGPWTFVEPDQIPGGFADIPSNSDMAAVRSSVAGTQEAKEAILENQIPQTAEVDRREARLEVTYDGQPKFERVGKTDMKYAVNTDKSVLQIDNRYYCCDNAIWFEADSPAGPWMVSVVVPDQVQEIPPESPVYNVKYVYIYDSTPEVVYVGYTPGYTHSYVYGGCVYYGTGYYYRPWYGVRYYPRPVTYGYNVHWNPYTGWGFSFGASYGWMTWGWGAPYYGYWGPRGYRYGYHYGYHHRYSSGYRAGYRAGYYAGSRNAYNRPTPYASRPRASANVYNNRAQGVRRSGDNTYNPRTGDRLATADRSTRPAAQPANRPNNVYTDRDGNVYRKDGNDWNRVDNSRPSAGQQPSTREARPSAGQQPSTREARPSAGQQPSTREARPSAGQPAARPTPSDRSSNTYNRPAQPRPSTGSGSLNQDYSSRSRGAERSQQYNQSRPQYQQRSSPPSRSVAPSRSAAPSRAAPSRAGGGARRR
jgi:hypothetical protein